MTIRPVFRIDEKKITRCDIEFEMANGFDPQAKQKSIYSLHKVY